MDFDFNIILVPVTLLLGAIWLLDKLVFRQRKNRGKGKESFAVRNAYDFFPILAFVLVVRSFIIEPFNIPSSSMVPTLYTGDFIAVNKSAYGLRLPLLNKKVVDTGSPERGDVAVFRYPENTKIYYIKRVIGLPGDTVSYDNGVLAINGSPLKTEALEFNADTTLTEGLYPAGTEFNGQRLNDEQAKQLSQQEEDLVTYANETIGKHTHLIRDVNGFESAALPSAAFLRKQSPSVVATEGSKWQITVPKDSYFVMGDNRDRSGDSRFWGFVADEDLSGKAVYLWMHKKPGLKLPTFSRNGKID